MQVTEDLATGIFAHDVIARDSARIYHELRQRTADGQPLARPQHRIDFGTIGTVDFAARLIVGHGSLYGGDSVYWHGTWYHRPVGAQRFVANGGRGPAPLPHGSPLWLVFALTAGADVVEHVGSTELRGTLVERFTLSLAQERIRGISAVHGISGLDQVRSRADVPVEVWVSADRQVIRLANASPPLKSRLWRSKAEHELWHCTDLWDFGVSAPNLPVELQGASPLADFDDV